MNLCTLTQTLKELSEQLVEAPTTEEREKIQDKIDDIQDKIEIETEKITNKHHDWV